MISDGRISAGDVNRYTRIAQLEEQLRALRAGRGGGRGRPRPGRPPAAAAAGRPGRRRRSRRITAQQLASRQLQGRYLGLIRQIPASQRTRYAKIAKDRGRESAIREMQSAINK
jgi:hypothetical protein